LRAKESEEVNTVSIESKTVWRCPFCDHEHVATGLVDLPKTAIKNNGNMMLTGWKCPNCDILVTAEDEATFAEGE